MLVFLLFHMVLAQGVANKSQTTLKWRVAADLRHLYVTRPVTRVSNLTATRASNHGCLTCNTRQKTQSFLLCLMPFVSEATTCWQLLVTMLYAACSMYNTAASSVPACRLLI